MISEGELLSDYRGTLVYLDANVLVPSITRTLILLCAHELDYTAVWSPCAEAEAERHQSLGARKISELRSQFDIPIVLNGESPVELVDTDDKDLLILSSAAACGSELLITENVKDFGVIDLVNLQMSAVHPDLFLMARVSAEVYPRVLRQIAAARQRFPNTAADIHATEVASRLPRLFRRHQALLGVDPEVNVGGDAKLVFRGVRCVACSSVLADDENRPMGFCAGCARLS